MKPQEDAIDDVKAGSTQVFENLAEEVSASAQEVKEKITSYSEEVVASIKESPFTAIGIAVGVGFLLGALVLNSRS